MMETQEKYLFYLSELTDYKIESGYADVRGWDVKDSALRTIGTVKNLLVNKLTEKVVYLDVEVDSSIIDAKHDPYGRPADVEIREFINEKGENHIIVPIGLVDINSDKEYVFTQHIDHKTFAETKRIRRNALIDREYETVVLDSYARRPRQTAIDVDADSERLEKVKQRDHIGEYREVERKTIPEKDVDWLDAENEGLKSADDRRAEEDFYRRNEFDDSRFRRFRE